MFLISVIIPTYNRAKFIAQAIESALSQPVTSLEVIVVDDGSTDETSQIVQSIRDPRLCYIHQVNRGKGAAINHGFEVSQGRYIGKLDSDDWYLPDALPELIVRLEQNPELGVAAGGYQIVEQNGALIERVFPWKARPDLDIKTWVKGCPVLWQGALVRREWFEKVGGVDPRISGPDDWDFGLRLVAAGCKMDWVEKQIFNYRLHEGTSIKSDRRYYDEIMAILERSFSDPALMPEIIEEKVPAYLQANINSAGREYAAGNYDQAKHSLSQAIQLDSGLLENGGKRLFFTIAWWAQSPLLTRDPKGFVRSVLLNLPGEAAMYQKKLRRALGELAAVKLYRVRESSDWVSVREAGFELLKADPMRFLDRGVLSAEFDAFFGPNLKRKIYHPH